MSLLEILDKHVDEKALGKDLIAKYVMEKFKELKAKVDSGEIDLIKGTSLDNAALVAIMASLEKLLVEG